jgi:hypothetical protein
VELTGLALWAWRRHLGAPAPGELVYQVKITLADVATRRCGGGCWCPRPCGSTASML